MIDKERKKKKKQRERKFCKKIVLSTYRGVTCVRKKI